MQNTQRGHSGGSRHHLNGSGPESCLEASHEIAVRLERLGRVMGRTSRKLEVLNGSEMPGLGQKAPDYLTTVGFDVVRIDATEHSDYRSPVVEMLTSDSGTASALATTLRCPLPRSTHASAAS